MTGAGRPQAIRRGDKSFAGVKREGNGRDRADAKRRATFISGAKFTDKIIKEADEERRLKELKRTQIELLQEIVSAENEILPALSMILNTGGFTVE